MRQAITIPAFLVGALGLMASPLPALAQEGPVGIAIVQAPEQATGIATGPNMETAFDDAIAQCVDGGALAEDCLRTNWCAPAGWTVDVFVQHQEGVHWHEFVCGLPSRAAAQAAALHVCDPFERDYLIECTAVQLYDPSGAAMMEW